MKDFKVLVSLIVLVFFVNYINYMMPNRDKLDRKINLLESKIEREKQLNMEKLNPKDLEFSYEKFFFNAQKYNYSQAMGKFQEIINKSTKSICNVHKLQWAQVPTNEKNYDILKINITLECTPKNIFAFVNKLRKNDILFYMENVKIYKIGKKPVLNISMQIESFRKSYEQ